MNNSKLKLKSIEEKKSTIQQLGLDAIEEYFGTNRKQIESLDSITLSHLHKKAQIAMQFEREMNITKRNTEMNYFRVFKLISEDKSELKNYIRKCLPNYSPD